MNFLWIRTVSTSDLEQAAIPNKNEIDFVARTRHEDYQYEGIKTVDAANWLREDKKQFPKGWNSNGCSVLWGEKFMKKSNTNILLYLLLVVGLWTFCFVALKLLLMPYSVAYTEYGKMTVGYFFVEHTANTFEYLVLTLAEFQNRKLSSKIIYIL